MSDDDAPRSNPNATLELFHAINDGGDSGAARALLAERGLVERFRFRNVAYDEVKADLAKHGGARTPAIWDGTKLTEGKDAVLAYLRAL